MSIFKLFRSRKLVRSIVMTGGVLKITGFLSPYYAAAQQNVGVNIASIGGVSPQIALCDGSTGILSTVINITSTQMQVVASTVSSNIVFVCGWHFTTGDSSNVVTWLMGTSTDCITGQAALSAAENFSSKSGISVPNAGSAQFRTSSGNSLCIEQSSVSGAGVLGMLSYRIST